MADRKILTPGLLTMKVSTVALVLTIGLFAGLGWHVWDTYRDFKSTQMKVFRLNELSGIVVHLDEVLTMSARMTAATGDLRWEQRYRGFEPQLEAAILEVVKLTPEGFLSEAAARTHTANAELVVLENRAFDRVRQGDREAAAALLSSEGYENQKKIYAEGIGQITAALQEQARVTLYGQRRRAFLAVTSSVVILPILLLAAIWVTRTLGAHITERKQVEEELRQSRQHALNILESITDAFYALDRQWRFTYLNRQAEHLLRRIREELLGKSALDEFPGAVDSPIFKQYHKAITEQVSIEFEEYYGPLKTWFDIRVYPYPDGLSVYFRDVTERKRTEEALRESEERYRSVVDNIGAGVALISPAMEVLSMNNQIKGWLPDINVPAKPICYHVFNDPPRESVCPYCPASKTFEDGQIHEAITDTPAGSKIRNYRIIASPLKDQEGKVVAVIEIAEDITERKRVQDQINASLQEKEVLLKEIHHRVKNNLQIISSMIHLQSGQIQDKQALEMFREIQNRVKSMALIHERLYQAKDLTKIDFVEYLRDLLDNLFRTYGAGSKDIALKLHVDEAPLGLDMVIPLGLIINELVCNSLKYAFPAGKSGEICVDLHLDPDHQFTLIVQDNGVGLPQDFDFQNTGSLGLQLVTTLTRQLEGTIELDGSVGTACTIQFRGQKTEER